MKDFLLNIWYDIEYHCYTKPKGVFRDIKRFFSNIYNYRYFLWHSYPWEFDNILEAAKVKAIIASKYFKETDILENSQKYAKELDLVVKLIDIVTERVSYLEETKNYDYSDFRFDENMYNYKFNHYVNTRNASRFVHYEPETEILKDAFYKAKADHLLWTYILNKHNSWWS